MRIIMSPHSGCYNHGCEAIVRSTVSMLDMPKDDIFLYSFDTDNDIQFGLDKICNLISNNSTSRQLSKLQNKYFALKEHLLHKSRDLEEIKYRNKNAIIGTNNVVHLSIGGDNYCYSGMQHILSEQIKLFSYNNISSVLWGCSLEDELLSDRVVEELKKHSLITVRESISYEMLADRGIQDNVILCSDPAFTLPEEKIESYDALLNEGQCVGVNISSLMGRFNAYPDATYKNIKKLLEYILNSTDYKIMLIPHVRQPGNDDLIPSKQLASELNNERIIVVDEDLNCMQLKYLISKCRMFIGCRTHATIAAYSTYVPTLVVGYSTKARGIANDIFGNSKDLLVDVREFESDNDLLRVFQSFYGRVEELRDHLINVMPDYINRAYLAKDALLNRF